MEKIKLTLNHQTLKINNKQHGYYEMQNVPVNLSGFILFVTDNLVVLKAVSRGQQSQSQSAPYWSSAVLQDGSLKGQIVYFYPDMNC